VYRTGEMRLWTIHPRHLDVRGLVALWREALLAQKVLRGQTRGYRHHPQLTRFRAQKNPVAAIASYLRAVHDEATKRGYQFDRRKIVTQSFCGKICETDGQLNYEWKHLQRKLKQRGTFTGGTEIPTAHPLFRIINGCVQKWERAIGEGRTKTK